MLLIAGTDLIAVLLSLPHVVSLFILVYAPPSLDVFVFPYLSMCETAAKRWPLPLLLLMLTIVLLLTMLVFCAAAAATAAADADATAYAEDDEVVPKNASLVVKRVPAKSTHLSLVARLQRRSSGGGGGPHHHAAAASSSQQKGEIVMPMRPDEEELIARQQEQQQQQQRVAASDSAGAAGAESKAPEQAQSSASENAEGSSVEGSEAEDVLKMLEEEDGALKPTAAALADIGSAELAGAAASAAGAGRGAGRLPVGAGRGAGGYPCTRCGRLGHSAKYCNTIGDPKYDPAIYLQNIPKAARKRVTSLEGIDTAHKTVRSSSTHVNIKNARSVVTRVCSNTQNHQLQLHHCCYSLRCSAELAIID